MKIFISYFFGYTFFVKIEALRNVKNILLYGYGMEGASTKRFLSRYCPQVNLSIYDEHQSEYNQRPLWDDVDILVLSPGIDRKKIPADFQGIITSNIELFFENIPESMFRKIIGISGTKGKSTTTKFTAELLENAGYTTKIVGNYGCPCLDVYDEFSKNQIDWLVAELSSFQLEHLHYSPHIAIFLNFYPDHLDRHETMDQYFQAKSHLWQYQKSNDYLVIPEKWGQFMASLEIPGRLILSENFPKEYFPGNSIFRAKHFLENLGTLSTLSRILNIPDRTLQKTAEHFQGLEHRCEFFTEKSGILFYDDAISTNPDSTLAALRYFGYNLGTILLGGQDRKQNFDRLLSELQKYGTHIVIFRSEVSDRLAQALKDYDKVTFVDHLDEGVKTAFQVTRKGKVCLLSTAAPSFGIWKNYREKGQAFKELVLQYEEHSSFGEKIEI